MNNHHPNISVLKSNWDGIKAEYCQMETTGKFPLVMPQSGVSIAFAPHDRATWSVDGGTSQTTPVAPGSVLIYANRNFVWRDREKASEWIHFELEPEILTRIANESGLSGNLELEHRILFCDPTILHLAQLLKAEVIKSGVAENIYLESLRNLLAVHLIRHYSYIGRLQLSKQINRRSHLTALQVKQLKEFIEENLDQKISIVQLASLVYLSQFHFARAFKEAVGITPHRYLTQRRIERAKILLAVTQLSVQEIAIKVGYINISHFTKQFRRYVGATPAAYRRLV